MQRWPGALPNAGGLDDQPLTVLEHARVLQSVYDAVYAFQNTPLSWADFVKARPAAWRVAQRFFELVRG